MKKQTLLLMGIALIAICAAACGWKPEVSAVPITAPWDAMNLPVKDNAIVWSSTADQLKVVHKDDKKTVLKNYTEALKSQGWTLGKFDDAKDSFTVEMSKGAEQLSMYIYDFSNTGVIIDKKSSKVQIDVSSPKTPDAVPSPDSTDETKKTEEISTDKVDTSAKDVIAAGKLLADYAKSKEAVQKQYDGKEITVRGFTRISATLSADGSGLVGLIESEKSIENLDCWFSKADSAEFMKIKGNQFITVKGIFDGNPFAQIQFCKLVKIE